MKRALLLLVLSISLASIFFSCQKEYNGRNGTNAPENNGRGTRGPKTNRPPVANAGADQVITLPSNSVNLNGSASTDPDNNIASYQWTKISGPSSFTIANPNAVQTQVTNLVEGVYQFDLKVTDRFGLYDNDVVQVTVGNSSPPPPCTTNCGKIVFVSDRDGNYEVYTCNADGSDVTRLTNDPAWDSYPAWSPDGTRIAFIRNENLFIMNADGSNVVQKTFANYVLYPAWSPDGTRIAFNDNYNGISIIDLTSGSISFVPNTQSTYYVNPSPAWSPDGTKIAFESDMGRETGIVDIFTISPAGSGLTNLTSNIISGDNYIYPAWSPDGTKLCVELISYTNRSIAVMNADGTGLTIIKTTEDDYYESVPSWSPDGTRIAYTESGSIKWVAANGSVGGPIITNGWDADWKH